jgi:hypothetical protein
MMKPNDRIKIKPTESGWREIVTYVEAFNEYMQKNRPEASFRMSAPNPDDAGYIEGPFWLLMQFFDWSTGAGAECPFEDMQIEEGQTMKIPDQATLGLLLEIADAADGLCHGRDWNQGTHAKAHRRRLERATLALRAYRT